MKFQAIYRGGCGDRKWNTPGNVSLEIKVLRKRMPEEPPVVVFTLSSLGTAHNDTACIPLETASEVGMQYMWDNVCRSVHDHLKIYRPGEHISIELEIRGAWMVMDVTVNNTSASLDFTFEVWENGQPSYFLTQQATCISTQGQMTIPWAN